MVKTRISCPPAPFDRFPLKSNGTDVEGSEAMRMIIDRYSINLSDRSFVLKVPKVPKVRGCGGVIPEKDCIEI